MKERGLSPDLMEYILEKELSYMRSQKLRIYAGVILDLYNENEEKAKKEENPGE
ncbi:MAG: hypothetical protein RHS_5923 [Robinsoniella sp. RHS]|nr:MAG: hypothetical protein RHS_5923 [Robinsoniella sp. RHS]